ncbi:unnamed protein product [Lepeophtheirus salmonis]|uniref:(salmon louse) hypothetical protein n=1 Tax=Lepeophtheirus salmonis TaxID=72036 RepID=A0A7R8CKS4_LEPSM|nr:unnamed protein product [Lepeophtheirus salmonis]CAF2806852.1 unnamed protein product [Lepeophtheirus salmonis]
MRAWNPFCFFIYLIVCNSHRKKLKRRRNRKRAQSKRKSSLKFAMSDTLSLNSFGSPFGGTSPGILAEEIGSLTLLTDFNPKKNRYSSLKHSPLSTKMALNSFSAKSAQEVKGNGVWEEGVILSLTNSMKKTERIKNKERLLVAHNITHGKVLELGEEYAFYDKANVLGKGVSHITPDLVSGESSPPTIYSASNLIRKLHIEDNALKPTPARAQVLQECLDGTIALTIQSSSSKSSKNFLVGAFRTKSATKNKFMIEWYLSNNKKDDIVCCKSPVKFSEDCEPLYLLTDPKDPRTVYTLCKTGPNQNSLYKLTKGLSKKDEDPLLIIPGVIEGAAIGITGDDVSTLLIYDGSSCSARLFSLSKSEGFRGRHPICAHCPNLEKFSSPSHVISCSSPNQKWQIACNVLGANVNNYQICLASLLDESGKFGIEPETGLPYRIRLLGCETQGVHAEIMLLEDLSRTFENAEDKLSNYVLKLCINFSPCRECQSHLSGWLMSGKLANIELHYVQSGEIIQDFGDRFVAKSIRRQGTFTKGDEVSSTSSPLVRSISGRSPRSSMTPGSRIPTRSGSGCPIPNASTPNPGVCNNVSNGCGNVSLNNRSDVIDSLISISSSTEFRSDNMKDLVANLNASLQNVLSVDASLRSNLMCLENSVAQIQQNLDP